MTAAVQPGTSPTAADLTEPLLSVVQGDPDAVELAALVTVLVGRLEAGTASAGAAPGGAGHSGWTDRSRLLREPIAPGASGWRRAAAPR